MLGVTSARNKSQALREGTVVSAVRRPTPMEHDVAGMMRLRRTKARMSGEDVTGRGEVTSLP